MTAMGDKEDFAAFHSVIYLLLKNKMKSEAEAIKH